MRALLFDCESTDLISNHTLRLDRQAEVIEFYGCVADLATGKVLHSYETLIKPSKPIPPEHIKNTPVTQAMVETAPFFRDVAVNIRVLVERAPVCIAHNISFDRELLDLEYERLQDRPLAWPHCICTVEQTVHLKGYRLSMDGMHEMLFGEKFKGAHRARTDVHALLRCCVALHEKGVL